METFHLYAKEAVKLVQKPQDLPLDEPTLIVGGAKLVRRQGTEYRSLYFVHTYSRHDKAAVLATIR